MEPLVSVIIPTFNGRKYICETLDSVFGQTYRNLEVIIVDDGSTDSTAEIVASYGSHVQLVRQQQLGHPAARNRGIRAATGEFLSFVDHDDLWLPAKIELQLQCFQSDPELDLVFGYIHNFFTPELATEERERIAAPMHPLPGLLQGAMLAKKSSFYRVGMFSEERDMGDFLDWYGRALALELKTHMQSITVLRRRIHTTNYQRTHKHLRKQYLPTLKQLLDRRRSAAAAAKE